MKKIYFIPRYIGSLKYYEKLFPALRERDCLPLFLLFEDKGMVEYCAQRNLECDKRFISLSRRIHVPFFTPFVRALRMRATISSFCSEQIDVLVTEPIVGQQVRALFKYAREHGIPTRALQWARHTDPRTRSSRTVTRRLRALMSRHKSLLHIIAYGVYAPLLSVMFWVADWAMGGDTFIFKATYTDRLGLIDETLLDYFLSIGWRKDQVDIVGFADYTRMADLVVSAEDPVHRRDLLAKNHLDGTKKNILVLSNPFHIGGDAVYLNKKGQYQYFAAVFEDIRSWYAEGEADILFKLHPRESHIYADFENRGVRIYHNEADLEELIVLADLYIAHPLTAANFIVRASQTPALFINFTPLEYMNEGKELYGLQSVVTSHEEFRKKLQVFKEGKLPLQYDARGVDTGSLRKIADFVSGKSTSV